MSHVLNKVKHNHLCSFSEISTNTATKHADCGISDVLSLSLLVGDSILEDTLPQLCSNAHENRDHLLAIHNHETLSIEPFKRPLHIVSQFCHNQPSMHLLALEDVGHLLLKHLLFDALEDFPLVQLEQSVLLIEFLLFLFV